MNQVFAEIYTSLLCSLPVPLRCKASTLLSGGPAASLRQSDLFLEGITATCPPLVQSPTNQDSRHVGLIMLTPDLVGGNSEPFMTANIMPMTAGLIGGQLQNRHDC